MLCFVLYTYIARHEWTLSVTATKCLRIQTNPDMCGRGLNNHVTINDWTWWSVWWIENIQCNWVRYYQVYTESIEYILLQSSSQWRVYPQSWLESVFASWILNIFLFLGKCQLKYCTQYYSALRNTSWQKRWKVFHLQTRKKVKARIDLYKKVDVSRFVT